MQPKATKSGFRANTNRPWWMHDKIMSVSEQKFIFLLVSLTENTPVTSVISLDDPTVECGERIEFYLVIY